MTSTFSKGAYPVPVNTLDVEREWRARNFSFGVFRDPPGQQWNDFVHSSDEYVVVAEGTLRIRVGDLSAICYPGDSVWIPRDTPHSLETLSAEGSVWLYGYGYEEHADV